jgi:hypothetical protein
MSFTVTALANNTSKTINGGSWQVQNANKSSPYNSAEAEIATGQTDLATSVFTFRVNSGDNVAAFDTPNKMRSEMAGPWVIFPNVAYNFAFDFLIEPGNSPSLLEWFIPFQIHGDDTVGLSPIFAFDIQPAANGFDEVLQFEQCYVPTGTTTPAYNTFGNVPFKRGVWNRVSGSFTDARGAATGAVSVTLNGASVLSRTGIVTGFSTAVHSSYAKFGIYAGVDSNLQSVPQAYVQPIVAHHANLAI